MKSSQSPSNPSSASAPLTTPPQKPPDEIDVIRAQFAALANERNTLKRSIQNDRTRRIELQQLIKDTREGIQKIMPKYSEFENEYVSVQSALSNEKEREKTLASRREKLGLEQRTLNENVEVMMLENEDAVKAHNDGLMILFDDFSEQLDGAYDKLLIIPNSTPAALASLDKLVTESPSIVPYPAKPLIAALNNERMTAAKISEDQDKLEAMTKKALGCCLHIKDKLVDHNSIMSSNNLGGIRTNGALECDKIQEYFEGIETVIGEQPEYKDLNLRECGDLEKDLTHIRAFALEETHYPRGDDMLLA